MIEWSLHVGHGDKKPLPPRLPGQPDPTREALRVFGFGSDLTYRYAGHMLDLGSIAVHHLFSIAFAVLYCAAVETLPAVAAWRGAAFGISVAILFHFVVLPIAGWAQPFWLPPIAGEERRLDGEHVVAAHVQRGLDAFEHKELEQGGPRRTFHSAYSRGPGGRRPTKILNRCGLDDSSARSATAEPTSRPRRGEGVAPRPPALKRHRGRFAAPLSPLMTPTRQPAVRPHRRRNALAPGCEISSSSPIPLERRIAANEGRYAKLGDLLTSA